LADEAVLLHQGRVAFRGPTDDLDERADLLSGGLA
jgi:ABC-type branched-subunit amino acid transport system ATPase component